MPDIIVRYRPSWVSRARLPIRSTAVARDGSYTNKLDCETPAGTAICIGLAIS